MRTWVLSVALLAGPAAWSADPEAGDEPTEESEAPADGDTERDAGAPPADAPPVVKPDPAATPQGPLAVPGPAGPPPTTPGKVATAPGITPAAPPPTEPGEPAEAERERPLLHVDTGYRLVWIGNEYLPTRRSPQGQKARPHLMHVTAGAMFDKNVYAGLHFETAGNPAAGTFPMVLAARVGWWDNAFGEAEKRGPFLQMPGVAITYVGWRWVHDYYRGQGGEWAFTGDSGGLVLGYTRAAPFGKLTVVTDSQFSLYLVGWKERADFPLGLLNQRLSIGFDPVFIDARFKSDPGTGMELSIGASMQAMF